MRWKGLVMCNFELFFLFQYLSFYSAESFTLLTEKPTVTHVDPTVVPFLNVSATRFGRRSLLYYITLHAQLDVPLDDNYTIQFLFYENVNNQYRRSFIELQFSLCNFIFKDTIFAPAIRRQLSVEHCPVPPAVYHLYNMTVAADNLPMLPFSKGRIYMTMKTKSKPILKGYCDIELKKNKPTKH